MHCVLFLLFWFYIYGKFDFFKSFMHVIQYLFDSIILLQNFPILDTREIIHLPSILLIILYTSARISVMFLPLLLWSLNWRAQTLRDTSWDLSWLHHSFHFYYSIITLLHQAHLLYIPSSQTTAKRLSTLQYSTGTLFSFLIIKISLVLV